MDEQDNTEEAVLITMLITRVDDQTFAVQFQRIRGTKIAFLKYYLQYKNYILTNFNDTNLDEKATKTAVEEQQVENKNEEVADQSNEQIQEAK